MTTGRAAACTHTERRRRRHARTHLLGGTLQHAVLLVSIRALGDAYPGRALGEAHGMHLVDYIGKLRSDAARCARAATFVQTGRTRLAATRCYGGMRDAHEGESFSAEHVLACVRVCVRMQVART